jgi:hypothetical protein
MILTDYGSCYRHVSSKGLLQTRVDTHQSLVRDYHRRVFILSQLRIYNIRLWYVLITNLQQIALFNGVKSLMNVNVWIWSLHTLDDTSRIAVEIL